LSDCILFGCADGEVRSLKAFLGHGLSRDCRSVTAMYECTLQPGLRSASQAARVSDTSTTYVRGEENLQVIIFTLTVPWLACFVFCAV